MGLARIGSKRFIRQAARQIKAEIVAKNGGRLPRSLQGWKKLCLMFGLDAVPLVSSPSRFKARLIMSEQGAFAFYNRMADSRTICRWLAHELAEKLIRDGLPSLFEKLPIMANYCGGDDPYDVRHRIAMDVQRLCFRER